MNGRTLACATVVLALLGSLTLIGSASCWPCDGTCGDLACWTYAGTGYCRDVMYHRRLNNERTSYNPLYEDCFVYCKWEIWQKLGYPECIKITQETIFCAQ